MSEWFSWTYNNRWLFVLEVIPIVLFVVWINTQNSTWNKTLKTSSFKNFGYVSPVPAWRFILPFLRTAALAFLIAALARPQDAKDESYRETYSEGIDIMLAFDVSTSMLAMDFSPNRLEAAREVAIDFIDKRKDDRIGLVIFEGEAFTQCPLTTDKNVLKSQFRLAEPGMMAQGTAIGMGLAVSVNRLRESTAKSKVIVLLTDGVNNQGNIDPVTAADIAKEFGIRVYTIGVGKKGKAKYPVPDYFGNITYQYLPVEIDEALLKDIAHRTGGEYYRATDKSSLQEIYNKIDQLEKTKMNVVEFRENDPPERFHIFAYIALALFGLELILKNTIFKSPLW